MKPLRLLAVIEASTITGPAKNLLQFAELAPSLGIEPVIATFDRSPGRNLFVESANAAGIHVHAIPERGAFDASVLRSFQSLVDQIQPDLLQTHAVKSHFLARLAGFPKALPWVAFHHGYTWTSWKTRAYNELDRWSLRGADRVLTVSFPFREELTARGVDGERIHVIHNAIAPDWGLAARNAEEAARLRAEWRIGPDVKVALIVGRLSREKDHIALLEAVHSIQSRVPVHLLVVGDGPERASIERRAKELGLEDKVTMAGQQKSVEVFYGIADVAVLSSRTEGSPNALLEAMSTGVPAVATAVGGIPEIVEDGVSALLVPAGDPRALAAALADVLAEGRGLGEMIAANARKLVLKRHHPEERVKRLAEIYQDVVARRALNGRRLS